MRITSMSIGARSGWGRDLEEWGRFVNLRRVVNPPRAGPIDNRPQVANCCQPALHFSSKQELQRELDLPRGRGRVGQGPRRAAEIAARENDLVRVREVRVIENIES